MNINADLINISVLYLQIYLINYDLYSFFELKSICLEKTNFNTFCCIT